MMKANILLLNVIIVHSFWVSNSLVCRFESNSNIYKWSKYQSEDDIDVGLKIILQCKYLDRISHTIYKITII